MHMLVLVHILRHSREVLGQCFQILLPRGVRVDNESLAEVGEGRHLLLLLLLVGQLWHLIHPSPPSRACSRGRRLGVSMGKGLGVVAVVVMGHVGGVELGRVGSVVS